MPQRDFSRAAVQILELHGVPSEKLKSFDALEDSTLLRNDVKEFLCVSLPRLFSMSSLQYSEWPTIPQIYMNGESIGGYDTSPHSYPCSYCFQCINLESWRRPW